MSGKLQEWLSTRYLLSILFDRDNFYCEKDDYGKPFLLNSDRYISFSHSDIWSAAIISKYEVGIDIQKLDNKIINIKNRVFSENELNHFESEENVNMLIKLWTLKEAGYKAYGKKEIEFKNNIKLGDSNIINVIDNSGNVFNYISKSFEFQDFYVSIAYQKK